MPVGEPFEPKPSTAPGNHDNLPVTHQHQFAVICLERESGKVVWEKVLHTEVPHEQGHYTGSLASNSCVTDGAYVVAFFGSFGLYCLDFDGNLLWEKDLGTMDMKHGHGESSSPVIVDDRVIVNWDHEGPSFIAAFDLSSGDELWRSPRDEETSWSSPIVVTHEDKLQVVVSATNRIRGYDPVDGSVIWECDGLSSNVVASPVSDGAVVVAGSSYEKQAMVSIRLDQAKGDVSQTEAVLWRRSFRTPYVPSPLLHEGAAYFLTHYQNVLNCVDAKTGKERFRPLRLDGVSNLYASPVATKDRIYFFDLDGAALVLSGGDQPKTLAVNQLNDGFAASPALVDKQLFVRGQQYLYCLEEESSED
jgi:outer membrane protein assembly factor BamB